MWPGEITFVDKLLADNIIWICRSLGDKTSREFVDMNGVKQ
jgi:hypothetical protein